MLRIEISIIQIKHNTRRVRLVEYKSWQKYLTLTKEEKLFQKLFNILATAYLIVY